MNTSTWVHANDCMLATVDTETTGLRYGYNDAISLAILPLNSDLKPSGIEPFNLIFKPSHTDHINPKAMKVNKITARQLIDAPGPESAWMAFEDWHERNVKANGFTKIIPIGQNIQFDMNMIFHWAGWDELGPPIDFVSGPNVNFSDDFFNWREARDTKIIAMFFNDLAYKNNKQFPFQKTNLGYIATQFNIDKSGAHDALQDCIMTAKIYRRFLAFDVGIFDFKAVTEDF